MAKAPLGYALVGSPDPNAPKEIAVSQTTRESSMTTNIAVPPHTVPKKNMLPPICVIHTNAETKSDHLTADCPDFITLSTENKWIIINQERVCPFCLREKHPVKDCPQRKEKDMCRRCRYTHAPLLGCIPPEIARFILKAKKKRSGRTATRENVQDSTANEPFKQERTRTTRHSKKAQGEKTQEETQTQAKNSNVRHF